MLAEIGGLRRGVDPALRVMVVLAPGLVETDRHVVPVLLEHPQAGVPKEPRPEEPWPARPGDRMNNEPARQCRGIPAARIKMDLVTVCIHAAGEVGDVGLAA